MFVEDYDAARLRRAKRRKELQEQEEEQQHRYEMVYLILGTAVLIMVTIVFLWTNKIGNM